MNLNIQTFSFNPFVTFRQSSPQLTVSSQQNNSQIKPLPVYGDDVIRTKPAQLSIFHMHDFHGQNIKMERAYSVVREFDNGTLTNQNAIFNKGMPIDKLKLCSGDMFLGSNKKEIEVVDKFMNLSGVIANAIGNHECDPDMDDFTECVKDRKYRLLGANMHPAKDSKVYSVLSDSLIVESNGNKYGVIGLVPVDMEKHVTSLREINAFNISDMNGTIKDLQNEINDLKKAGINKIILLSHLGLNNEQYIAQNVSDIDIILGGHTHDFLSEPIEGKNLFYSPKGEPVFIMQVGKDGNYIGMPNVKFNELGQITDLQYNIINTENFDRSLIATQAFEEILGKPEVLGYFDYVEDPPKNALLYENPHADLFADCMRKELNTDIAILNSSNLRNKFCDGEIDMRLITLISPFDDDMVVCEITEKELVDGLNNLVKLSLTSNMGGRPGIMQVSGLRYEYSKSKMALTKMSFIDKKGIEHKIDVDNPREDKTYTLAIDDFCLINDASGGAMGLKKNYDNAIAIYDFDKNELVANYLKKQNNKPQQIKSDGRIKVID
ncbi:MAG: 5'-nucleotidase C-terminal domain-containing protein [bacterium]|nr:5'-nucleotidase C-terminal domain-containing protein [bacterium]